MRPYHLHLPFLRVMRNLLWPVLGLMMLLIQTRRMNRIGILITIFLLSVRLLMKNSGGI
jgi:hypothetical protein